MQRQHSPYTGRSGLGSAGFVDAATVFSSSSFNSGDFSTKKFNSTSATRYTDDGLNSMSFLSQTQQPQTLMRSLSSQRMEHSCGGAVHSTPKITLAARQLVSNFNNNDCLDSGNCSYDGAGDMSMLTSNQLNFFSDSNIAAQHEACPLLRKMKQNTKQLGMRRSSDSDSDSEYCMQLKTVRTKETQLTRWQRVFYYIMSGLTPQRQRQMGALLQRCSESIAFKLLLILLQLISILLGNVLQQALHLARMTAGLRFKLWRCRFQLRITMRDLLWRLTNAKTNDTLLFLIMVLGAPWLFLIGLFGFCISLVYALKTGLLETLRQMRLRVVC